MQGIFQKGTGLVSYCVTKEHRLGAWDVVGLGL